MNERYGAAGSATALKMEVPFAAGKEARCRPKEKPRRARRPSVGAPDKMRAYLFTRWNLYMEHTPICMCV